MIRRNRKQRLVAEINITPFTDVILVLLVIFMITTPLISELRIKVNLPDAKSGKRIETSRPEQIDITVSREGPVYLNGTVVSRRELRDQVERIRRDNPDASVLLRSDKNVKFQDIVNVLDPLTDLGISRINIAATQEE